MPFHKMVDWQKPGARSFINIFLVSMINEWMTLWETIKYIVNISKALPVQLLVCFARMSMIPKPMANVHWGYKDRAWIHYHVLAVWFKKLQGSTHYVLELFLGCLSNKPIFSCSFYCQLLLIWWAMYNLLILEGMPSQSALLEIKCFQLIASHWLLWVLKELLRVCDAN